MLLAIFDQAYQLLGEVALHQGVFKQVMLLPKGEERLGNYFELWQSMGVPEKKMVADAFIMERVAFSSKHFYQALRIWLQEQHFIVLDVQDLHADCWQRLSQLPLDPVERYVYGAALISCASHDSLAVWRHALEDAWSLFIREQEKATKVVETLKQHLGKQLVKPFETVAKIT